MPSSMIFVGLVVLWLLILVPAVARHRQEVARPSTAALSGRVLNRPRRRPNMEVDGVDSERTIDDTDEPRTAVSTADRDDVRVPAPRTATAEPDLDEAEEAAGATRYAVDDEPDGPDHDDPDDDRLWERPPPRFRPGRGGYDPEAAAEAARARYAFRQRVVLAMLLTAVVTGVLAAVAVPGLWWPHAAVDMVLVGYLVYLRRQVRMEESIRDRRAARMAGTRVRQAAEDPELDEWARRGREETRDDRFAEEPAQDEPEVLADDELEREQPERVAGAGASLKEARELADPIEEGALPRLQPAPPVALPAGTTLVEADEDDPALHELDSHSRPGYRRAVGE